MEGQGYQSLRLARRPRGRYVLFSRRTTHTVPHRRPLIFQRRNEKPFVSLVMNIRPSREYFTRKDFRSGCKRKRHGRPAVLRLVYNLRRPDLKSASFSCRCKYGLDGWTRWSNRGFFWSAFCCFYLVMFRVECWFMYYIEFAYLKNSLYNRWF